MHKYLDTINSPDDLKKLKESELPQLASELREFIIETVAKTGGHLASNLGSVELTLALQYCFESPVDKFIWDGGHQAYPSFPPSGPPDQLHCEREDGGLGVCPKR